MKRLATFFVATILGLSMAPNAFSWGTVTGPRGGAAYRGPFGGAAVRGPYGGAAVRGPYGVAYIGGVRPWVAAPYYGAAVDGVTLGALIAATAVPPVPAPGLCWYWSSPAHNQGYWDYCYR